jgi:ferredoxin
VEAEVDPVQCALTGYCVEVAPELFQLGSEHAVVRAESINDPGLRELAIEAESLCPTAAIRLLGL